MAHKSLTPGLPVGRPPGHRSGHRPKRFMFMCLFLSWLLASIFSIIGPPMPPELQQWQKKKTLLGAVWKMSRIFREVFCGPFLWKLKDENLWKSSSHFSPVSYKNFARISLWGAEGTKHQKSKVYETWEIAEANFRKFQSFSPDFRRLLIHFDRFSFIFNQFQSVSISL